MYLVNVYGKESLNFRKRERALSYIKREAKKWCCEHDIDFEETEYNDGDEEFCYGIDDEGFCAIKLYEVPKFNNRVEELLWNAKFQMDLADNASEEYKYTLEDCCVDGCTSSAREYIDEAINLIKEMGLCGMSL